MEKGLDSAQDKDLIDMKALVNCLIIKLLLELWLTLFPLGERSEGGFHLVFGNAILPVHLRHDL